MFIKNNETPDHINYNPVFNEGYKDINNTFHYRTRFMFN